MRDGVDLAKLRRLLVRAPTLANMAVEGSRVIDWVKGFPELGKAVCVRAAVGAARAALEAWETYETIRTGGPYERIAAAEAWLACPCAAHEKEAEKLAWANGDDNALKWTRLVVDGKDIEPMEAIYAHWSSDNAVSVTHNDVSLAAQIVETAIGSAGASLRELHPHPACTLRVVESVARELRVAHLTSREEAFLEAIDRDPEDEATRQVYADWLEEAGRTADATAVRGSRVR